MPIPLLLLLATSPVGVWQGHFVVNLPKLPASAPNAVRAKYVRDLAALRNGRFRMILGADHGYALHTVGLPMLGPADTKGTWSQRRSTVSVLEAGKKRAQSFTLDSSGKRLTAPMGRGVVVVFTR